MSPAGDMVLIPNEKEFAAIIFARDYERWLDDPGRFTSCRLTSRLQIEIIVTAIAAEAGFVLEEREGSLLLIFQLPNELVIAVVVPNERGSVHIDYAFDFILLPDVVLHSTATLTPEPTPHFYHQGVN